MTYAEVFEEWQKHPMRAPFQGEFLIDYVTGISKFAGININRQQVQSIITFETLDSVEGNLRDMLSIANNKRVARYVNNQLQNTENINVAFLLELHHFLMFGSMKDDIYDDAAERAGQFRHGKCQMDRLGDGITPEKVPGATKEVCEAVNMRGDPVTEAASFCYRFMQVLPFADGNLRVGVWAANYILLSAGAPPFIPTPTLYDKLVEVHRNPTGIKFSTILESLCIDSYKSWSRPKKGMMK